MVDKTSYPCPKCGRPADRRFNETTNMLEAGCDPCQLWIAQSGWNAYVRVIEDWKLRTAMGTDEFHEIYRAIVEDRLPEEEARKKLIIPPFKRAN